MSSQLKRALPVVAVVAALVAVLILTLSSNERQAALADTGETRAVVEAALAQVHTFEPAGPLSPRPGIAVDLTFLGTVDLLEHTPYVATVWIFAPDGRIVYAAGSTAASASSGTAEEHATDETRRVLASLPAGALTADQRLALLASSAIQSEGEHNDVYRHLVREVHGADGSLYALIGVAYDVSPAAGAAPTAGWIASMLGLVLALGVYWLSLPLWVWLDARERGERAPVWAAFVFLGNLVALLAYLLARAPSQG